MIHLRNFSVMALVLLLFSGPVAEGQNLVEELQNTEEVSLFAEALQQSDLSNILSQNGPYTIFAPNNEAMRQAYGSGQISYQELRNHLMTGMATERNIRIMSRMTSLGGVTLNITRSNDSIRLNGARIIRSNIRTDNGVIHIIDRVLE